MSFLLPFQNHLFRRVITTSTTTTTTPTKPISVMTIPMILSSNPIGRRRGGGGGGGGLRTPPSTPMSTLLPRSPWPRSRIVTSLLSSNVSFDGPRVPGITSQRRSIVFTRSSSKTVMADNDDANGDPDTGTDPDTIATGTRTTVAAAVAAAASASAFLLLLSHSHPYSSMTSHRSGLILCDSPPAPLTSTGSVAGTHSSPRDRNGINPDVEAHVYKRLSLGSLLGLTTGLIVGSFSHTLALILSLSIVSMQWLASHGLLATGVTGRLLVFDKMAGMGEEEDRDQDGNDSARRRRRGRSSGSTSTSNVGRTIRILSRWMLEDVWFKVAFGVTFALGGWGTF